MYSMKIFITKKIPSKGIEMLRERGYDVTVNAYDRTLSKDELITELSKGRYDAVLCLLTDAIDDAVLAAAGETCKIFANYAVGFDNIDLKAALARNILITNTPGVLTDTVAEHAFALLLALAHRIPESDRFTKEGKYKGWEPMLLLGRDVSRKVLGIVGLGRIGSRVAYYAAKGFEMKILYYDVHRSEEFEKEYHAEFRENIDDLFSESDAISIHVPLLPTTHHLVNEARLKRMKPTALLINTSRGPVIDEKALLQALENNVIRGAALDVFEYEPAITPGLEKLDNVILTPHTASATEETRQAMSECAAHNIIEALEGRNPPNLVKIK